MCASIVWGVDGACAALDPCVARTGDEPALILGSEVDGWTLNLSQPGQGIDEARPGPLALDPVDAEPMFGPVGAPQALEARLP